VNHGSPQAIDPDVRGPGLRKKITLANLLAGHSSINAVVINHDLIKSFFLDSGIMFQVSAELTYNLQWVLAGDLLRQGRNVVVDSTCNYQMILDQGTALAQKHGYDYAHAEWVLST
jgi:predicted kinase